MKTKNLIFIIFIAILCALAFVFYKLNSQDITETNKQNIIFSDDFVNNNAKEFSDGLTNPASETKYPLDEFDTGISEKNVYYIDINNDKKLDRITKTFFETGNAHSYYQYNVELNIDGKYIDITPSDFRTTNGDMCDLQQIQFIFKPSFRVVIIYRELGDTWNAPTMAKKKTYKIKDNKFEAGEPETLRNICDVKELF